MISPNQPRYIASVRAPPEPVGTQQRSSALELDSANREKCGMRLVAQAQASGSKVDQGNLICIAECTASIGKGGPVLGPLRYSSQRLCASAEPPTLVHWENATFCFPHLRQPAFAVGSRVRDDGVFLPGRRAMTLGLLDLDDVALQKVSPGAWALPNVP